MKRNILPGRNIYFAHPVYLLYPRIRYHTTSYHKVRQLDSKKWQNC